MTIPQVKQFAEIGRYTMEPTGIFRSLKRLLSLPDPALAPRPDLECAIVTALSEPEPTRRGSYPSLRIRHFCRSLLKEPGCPGSPTAALLLHLTTAETVLRQMDEPVAVAFREALAKLYRLDPRQSQIVTLYHAAGISPSLISEYMEDAVETVAAEINTGQMFLQAELARSGFTLQDLDRNGIRSSGTVTSLLGAGAPLRVVAGQRYDVLRRQARPVKRRFSHDPLYDTTEAVNEAVIRLLDKAEQRPGNEREFLGLFMERVRHVAIDHGRIGQKRGQNVPHFAVNEEIDAAPRIAELNPEEKVLKRESDGRVGEAMKRLRQQHPQHAAILAARYYETDPCSIEELAVRFQRSPASIKRRLKEAVEFLRENAG